MILLETNVVQQSKDELRMHTIPKEGFFTKFGQFWPFLGS